MFKQSKFRVLAEIDYHNRMIAVATGERLDFHKRTLRNTIGQLELLVIRYVTLKKYRG